MTTGFAAWLAGYRQTLVDDLMSIVAIPSVNPPGGEAPVAEYLAQRLLSLGAEAELVEVAPGRPNVIGRWRFGPGPTFLLTSHMDVVPAQDPSQFRPRLADGRIIGRGACDAKGQLISLLGACAALAADPPAAGTLLYAGCIGEEGEGIGTAHLAKTLRGVDAAVVGEPGGLIVNVGHRGAFRATYTFLGQAHHSSDPDRGVNAIYRAARFCLAIEHWHKSLKNRAINRFGPPVAGAGVIHGGQKINIVPDRCSVEVDRRLNPGETAAGARAELQAILAGLQEEDRALRYEEQVDFERNPALIADEHPFVRLACRVAAEVANRAAATGVCLGGTDQVYLLEAGVPTVVLGPGELGQAHTATESIAVSDLEEAVRVYSELARRVFAGAPVR